MTEERPRQRRLNQDPVETPPAGAPARAVIEGRLTRLEPLDPAHLGSLFELSHGDAEKARVWDYLPYGPFEDRAAFARWLEARAASEDPLFFTVLDRATGRPEGVAISASPRRCSARRSRPTRSMR